jgi:hypothetical protein
VKGLGIEVNAFKNNILKWREFKIGFDIKNMMS